MISPVNERKKYQVTEEENEYDGDDDTIKKKTACHPSVSFLLLVLCGGEPGIQELLAVVDLPGVHLHGHNYEQVEDGHS